MARDLVRAGLYGGLVGGVSIWVYEAFVWVGVQDLMPLAGIPRNAVGLVFGPTVQTGLGAWAYLLGTAIHFMFALGWGLLFAWIWPQARRRGIEATMLALPFAALAWLAMHLAIALVSTVHPNYLDPVVVIGGLMSHLFYSVPLAVVVKRMTAFDLVASETAST